MTDKGIVDEFEHAVGLCLRCFVASSKTVLNRHLSVALQVLPVCHPSSVRAYIAIHYGPHFRALCSPMSIKIGEHREQPRDLCPRAHKTQDGVFFFEAKTPKTKSQYITKA